MLVTREFTFDSAHFLTNYYGKCERVHGHTYRLQVTLEGKVQENGLVIDFVLVKRIVKRQILDKLDHQLINDVIENPSAERMVMWMWDQIKDLQNLLKVELSDPNLGSEIKKLLKKSDQEGDLIKSEFDKELRLHELKLWETPNSFVAYKGE
ncbi:MAG: 6-carboxytetrahydropterin synthase QueD [Candidatus Gracilibacteria bacterium]|jgi:6-pyruvoyltetrahydropterin/6-carboxytetrahydropterin synthase